MSSIETVRMPYAASVLARVRATLGAQLLGSRDLLVQVEAVLAGTIDVRRQLQERNRWIRFAALLLPGEMSVHGKAGELLKLAGSLPRKRPKSDPWPFPRAPITPLESLRVASLHGRLVASRRQFLRILESSSPED